MARCFDDEIERERRIERDLERGVPNNSNPALASSKRLIARLEQRDRQVHLAGVLQPLVPIKPTKTGGAR